MTSHLSPGMAVATVFPKLLWEITDATAGVSYQCGRLLWNKIPELLCVATEEKDLPFLTP